MRRVLLAAAALIPLAIFVGCNHMAGMCDCDCAPTITCPYCCHAPYPEAHPSAGVPVITHSEAIKDLPKDAPKPVTPDK